MVKKKTVLLTNDDGIHAKGLHALIDAFHKHYHVVVVAPDIERSAASHSITLIHPLRVHEVFLGNGIRAFAVNGTPADCVKIAVRELFLSNVPDLVVSGINAGANIGIYVHYSGTVAAAKESSMYGIPSIAVSLDRSDNEPDYQPPAKFTLSIAEQALTHGLPYGTLLNINFPSVSLDTIPGVMITKHGISPVNDSFQKSIDPRKTPYYWHGADAKIDATDIQTDCGALYRNYITITPILCDMTDVNMLESLRSWNIP
ncbi:MAG: 5'/3'-nucleotidase SurE [Desulfobacterales bacterium]|nr:5'/3'-nucleotidase SurE [Desulfobacterales bacterium]